MATRISFLRLPRVVSVLFCVLGLASAPAAQPGGGGHGGGGGHSGGGHSAHSSGGHASGHSSSTHAGGHFGWLRVFARHGKPAGRAESSDDLSSPLWNFNALRGASAGRLPATMIWSPAQIRPGRDNHFFGFKPIRHPPGFFLPRFERLPSSGCFFNGVTQVCFFEPFWPLCFAGDFGFFYSDFGFGGGLAGVGDDSGVVMPELSGMSAVENPWDNDREASSPGEQAAAAAAAQDWDLDKRVYVLVLRDGVTRLVTDYWTSNGYLEYVSPDGSRSHIPLDALDLTATVARNTPRGLRFMLRSEP